ncbi:MAG: hypothetical protein P4L41_14565 [Flavipsychrobacter sp.]|nr:hypothetical protein [Flavipsychrobacter sp.]
MKFIYAAIALIALTTSCKTQQRLADLHTAKEPYVQLKDGAKFTGSDVDRKHGAFKKDKITLGDTSFRTKDVAFYSPGDFTYANIGRKTFATQVLTGKINMYRYESTSTSYSGTGGGFGGGGFGGGMGHTTTQHHLSYYIQKTDDAPVVSLSYNHLKPMITPRTPEFKMLEKYRTRRVTSRALIIGSGILFAGGVALLGGSSDTQAAIGGAAMLAGVGSFFSWFFVAGTNRLRLYKAVLLADHAKKTIHKSAR